MDDNNHRDKRIEALQEEIESCRRRLGYLKESEEKYRRIFDNSGAPSMIIEEDMTIVMANQEFEKLTGYTKKEIENRIKWARFITEDDLERMKGYHFDRRRGKIGIPNEYECKVKDRYGNIKYIFVKVGMIDDNRSIASFMDITLRKRAEKDLSMSEAKLSAMIEATDSFIYSVTGDYRIDFVNGAIIRFLGRDPTEEKCHQAIYGLASPCPWCRSGEVFDGEGIRFEYKNPNDGRWYFTIGSPIFNSHGSVERMQVMIIDINDRKLKEEALAEEEKRLRKENVRLRLSIQDHYRFGEIVGKSLSMQDVYDQIVNAANVDANVIIYGESGTGKELVAKTIHQLSDRRDKPFVVVNCGAIPENLLESEFFGYKKGAFTGADRDRRGYLDLAEGGVLFLDEIGEIGLNLQVKLLRAIEGGGYTPVGGRELKIPNIRIVAATNRNLKDAVKKGAMRPDFYYRIHIIPINLPPLRERKEDILLLVEHFLSAYDGVDRLNSITGKMIEAMHEYDWPGNVRELQNMLHRYATIGSFDLVDDADSDQSMAEELIDESAEISITDLKTAAGLFEKKLILRALEKNRWHRVRTAEALGINRKTLFKKMKAHGIE